MNELVAANPLRKSLGRWGGGGGGGGGRVGLPTGQESPRSLCREPPLAERGERAR